MEDGEPGGASYPGAPALGAALELALAECVVWETANPPSVAALQVPQGRGTTTQAAALTMVMAQVCCRPSPPLLAQLLGGPGTVALPPVLAD